MRMSVNERREKKKKEGRRAKSERREEKRREERRQSNKNKLIPIHSVSHSFSRRIKTIIEHL